VKWRGTKRRRRRIDKPGNAGFARSSVTGARTADSARRDLP
jgi:hypothetical protein